MKSTTLSKKRNPTRFSPTIRGCWGCRTPEQQVKRERPAYQGIGVPGKENVVSNDATPNNNDPAQPVDRCCVQGEITVASPWRAGSLCLARRLSYRDGSYDTRSRRC